LEPVLCPALATGTSWSRVPFGNDQSDRSTPLFRFNPEYRITMFVVAFDLIEFDAGCNFWDKICALTVGSDAHSSPVPGK